MRANPENAEQRTHPRVNLFRPLKLIHQNGSVIKASLRDISPGGVQAICDRESAQDLGSDGRVSPSAGPQVFAAFNLPVGDGFVDIEVDCRMIHLSLAEDEGVAIGLRYVSFRGPSLDNLRQFILASMEPAY